MDSKKFLSTFAKWRTGLDAPTMNPTARVHQITTKIDQFFKIEKDDQWLKTDEDKKKRQDAYNVLITLVKEHGVILTTNQKRKITELDCREPGINRTAVVVLPTVALKPALTRIDEGSNESEILERITSDHEEIRGLVPLIGSDIINGDFDFVIAFGDEKNQDQYIAKLDRAVTTTQLGLQKRRSESSNSSRFFEPEPQDKTIWQRFIDFLVSALSTSKCNSGYKPSNS